MLRPWTSLSWLQSTLRTKEVSTRKPWEIASPNSISTHGWSSVATFFTDVAPDLVFKFADQHGISRLTLAKAYLAMKKRPASVTRIWRPTLSQWRLLLGRTIGGLALLREKGSAVPDWILGGGTALMLHTGHRLSKDIDAFITDPQYLPILSPRLGGESVWACETYAEAANHLKLVFPDGEIDFIVATPITELASEAMTIPDEQGSLSVQIEVEHPVEIALKKLVYRAGRIEGSRHIRHRGCQFAPPRSAQRKPSSRKRREERRSQKIGEPFGRLLPSRTRRTRHSGR